MTTPKPDGDYVMVPREPTTAMLLAAHREFPGRAIAPKAIWLAMLAAAPPPPPKADETLAKECAEAAHNLNILQGNFDTVNTAQDVMRRASAALTERDGLLAECRDTMARALRFALNSQSEVGIEEGSADELEHTPMLRALLARIDAATKETTT